MTRPVIEDALFWGAGASAAYAAIAIIVALARSQRAHNARWAACVAAAAAGDLAAAAALTAGSWFYALMALYVAGTVIWMVYPGRQPAPVTDPAGTGDPDPDCPQCGGTGLVCGDHPGRSASGCSCGAAAMGCTICTPNSSRECVDTTSGGA
ncbi:MAG: hypothetical protein M0030_11460 [Actinomycetota bacterium]|nr:hypothetical protein [Actinomycetota bacterium]